jgi:hypothetical protein
MREAKLLHEKVFYMYQRNSVKTIIYPALNMVNMMNMIYMG